MYTRIFNTDMYVKFSVQKSLNAILYSQYIYGMAQSRASCKLTTKNKIHHKIRFISNVMATVVKMVQAGCLPATYGLTGCEYGQATSFLHQKGSTLLNLATEQLLTPTSIPELGNTCLPGSFDCAEMHIIALQVTLNLLYLYCRRKGDVNSLGDHHSNVKRTTLSKK